jgi:SOS-response transcriptional repressor LexA
VGVLLRARRERLGISLSRLAELSGCAKSYLWSVENSHRGPPSDEILARLELALMLERGSLVEAARWERSIAAGGDTLRRRIEELEQRGADARKLRELILSLRGGAAGGRKTPLDQSYLEGKLREFGVGEAADLPPPGVAPHAMLMPLRHEIPLINKVAAGYPREFTDLGYPARVADEYIRVPDLQDPDAFAARVVGDSMLPDYAEGDIVIFSPMVTVRSGMDCFARLEPDHDTTFKRIYFEGESDQFIRLQPLNSVYPPRTVPREEVAGLYAAVSVMRRVVGPGAL